MEKEVYLKKIDKLKESIKNYNEEIVLVKNEYINLNKKFNLDDMVKITRENGRSTTGRVNGFGILNDKNVYVTSIRPTKGAIVYISVPYKSIEQIENL